MDYLSDERSLVDLYEMSTGMYEIHGSNYFRKTI